MIKLEAAVDFSSGKLTFAVSESNGAFLFEAGVAMSGRDSSGIVPWITLQLKEHGFSLESVGYWTCGSGPGSFTGLRIIAGLVAGFAFETDAEARGVPSAVALAAEADAAAVSEPDSVTVLYDGRRGEIFCCRMEKHGGFFRYPPENTILPVVSAGNTEALDGNTLPVAMKSDRELFSEIIPENILQETVFIDEFPVRRLLEIPVSAYPWDSNSLLHPVYLRPPVHVPPASVRQDV